MLGLVNNSTHPKGVGLIGARLPLCRGRRPNLVALADEVIE
jgi:hypothetical protein